MKVKSGGEIEKELGLRKGAITYFIKKGYLSCGQKVGQTWLFTESEIEKIREIQGRIKQRGKRNYKVVCLSLEKSLLKRITKKTKNSPKTRSSVVNAALAMYLDSFDRAS